MSTADRSVLGLLKKKKIVTILRIKNINVSWWRPELSINKRSGCSRTETGSCFSHPQ